MPKTVHAIPWLDYYSADVHQKSRRGGKEIEEHPFKVKNSERADRRLYTQEPGLNTYAMPLTISGELDVIDIQLNIQTTDPTATVEKMDKYMALESTKFRKFELIGWKVWV